MQQTFIVPCPCFPGFYHTALFDPDIEYYAVNNTLKELAPLYGFPAELLKDCEHRFGNILTVNNRDFEHDVAEEFVSRVEEYLEGILKSGCTLKLRSIDRPTFYNYRNDIAVIEATFNPDEAISYCCEHYEAFKEYLEARYDREDADPEIWLAVPLWERRGPGDVLDFIIRDYVDREYVEDAEQRLCREALEEYIFEDYIGMDWKIETALESDAVHNLGVEYERELKRCDAYVEAMHNTPRSRELADAARKKIEAVYPERLAMLLGLPVEKKEPEDSGMIAADLFA